MPQQDESAGPFFQVQRQVGDEGQARVVVGDEAGEGMLSHQPRRHGTVRRLEMGWLVHEAGLCPARPQPDRSTGCECRGAPTPR